MSLDVRYRYIIAKLADAFPACSAQLIEDYISSPVVHKAVGSFLKGEQKRLLFFVDEGEQTEIQLLEPSHSQTVPKSSCAYFVRRSNKAVQNNDQDIVMEITSGVIDKNSIDSLTTILSEIFIPIFSKQSDWGKNSKEQRKEFITTVSKFVEKLSHTIDALHPPVELRKPDPATLPTSPQSFSRVSPETLLKFEDLIEEWGTEIETVLNERESVSESSDEGPMHDIEYWRSRYSRLANISEQLKDEHRKTVIGVVVAARGKGMQRWRQLDIDLTDATNEAKDNVKYLNSLEPFIEPLYTGNPTTIIDVLPGLINNIRMMYAIARYYSTQDRMTNLFVKITNQMITNCKDTIREGGTRLWEQDPAILIKNLKACVKLNDAYQEQYRMAKEKLLQNPEGKQFDFNELKMFGQMDLFCKRILKLIEIFTTVEQFTMLANHNIDGMQGLIDRFYKIVEEFKRKSSDLLDYVKPSFDRDFADFNKKIADLEQSLQVFINSSFENITSTESALDLLKKFNSTLQRENLKADLDSKYTVIFHNYGLHLEHVQKTYERYKKRPPKVRNSPPVAGNIIWSRQLLRRIEEPMKKFQSNKAIMASKESKKIIKTYNKVASALYEFETLWLNAWKSSIDKTKMGLQATLIVKDPTTNKLHVNFDRAIHQLAREAKWLIRMAIDVPENAKMVLMQEVKFKSYYNQLSYILKEYDRVLGKVNPVTKPLLLPMLEDLEAKILPGMQVLTWTSLNIDAYLQTIGTGVERFEEIVSRINDIIEYRIENNLLAITRAMLVHLPEESCTLDQFVETQERHVKQQAQLINIKNQEIETAVEDVMRSIHVVNENPENYKTEITAFRRYYNRLVYRALLNTTVKSLGAMRERIAYRQKGDAVLDDTLFFNVSVELDGPDVILNPTHEEVQMTIYRAGKTVIACSKQITPWAELSSDSKTGISFGTAVASDKEIVRKAMLLAGSSQSLKKQVSEYLKTFSRYDGLLKDDKQATYNKFLQAHKNPQLEDFEEQFKKYLAVEQEIMAIQEGTKIGPLSLDTRPLKAALLEEVASWKAQYAKNLHQSASEELHRIILDIDESTKKLQTEITDLEILRFVMDALRRIREQESTVDFNFQKVEDQYNLLKKYDVKIPKEEHDTAFDLSYKWSKLTSLANNTNSKVAKLQGGFRQQLIQSVTTFSVDVIQFSNEFETHGPGVDGIKPQEAIERLKKYNRLFKEKERRYETNKAGEQLFGLPVHEYPQLSKIKKDLGMLDKLYDLYSNVLHRVQIYEELLWNEVDFQSITDEMNVFAGQCKKLPQRLRKWEAFLKLKKTIDDFLELQPLLEQLSDKAMRKRHWDAIMEITGKTFKLDPDVFKLKHIIEANMLDFKEDIEEICIGATKEAEIEIKLRNINADWAEKELTFGDWKHKIILKGQETQEVMENLEDSQQTLGSIMSSRYVAPFREDVGNWLHKLSSVAEVIEQWMGVQAMWIYLEAVFVSGDIVKQLPQEAKKFAQIDKQWAKIMSKAADVKNVIQFCFENEMLKSLPTLRTQLEECQKQLTGYLEQKRNIFPRFYFVSDPILLEILSQSSDPHSIQEHLISIFDSISEVTFDTRQKNKVLVMHSPEGETVSLSAPVIAQGNVEDWLQVLETEMQTTLRDIIRDAAEECKTAQLKPFIDKYPAQVALLGIQLMWTYDCEEALNRARNNEKTAMQNAAKKINNVFLQLTDLTTQELIPRDRTKIETLITIQVHQRDVFEELHKVHKIKDPNNFEWQKQARFYWRPESDTAKICIADIEFEYCYEYLGCKERLVITPLTDRCYITLSQALGMKLGGAPAGPAGTGKTETVKDLGRTLGKYVVVFNCSDQMDFRAMGKIFKGLAQSGAWGDFDEFNRILLPVLSVVAQQIQCVLTAIRERKKTFVFTDGQVCRLIDKTGFFITMNPGYQGRQELPENLKVLFRGVTMMVPDRRMIIRVKLAAAGYKQGDVLSKKFHVLYNLCEQQLSKQRHYDFGLRNILSVLRTAGITKRSNPDKSESYLLMRTLRDMNTSKLVVEDNDLFASLINDLFPGMKAEKRRFPEIESTIESLIEKNGLVNHKQWFEKIIQLYETSLVRHGIMVVGPSGTGKTKCYDILLKALSVIDKPHREYRMNPKAISAPQMFGRFDKISNDWTDGIFSFLWRQANKQKKQNIWIVCDGPVDAIWIENLNTVLDDNKLLTLASGDRIPMAENVKMCFEVENLNNASPATVSRAGQIYISDATLGWKPVVESRLTVSDASGNTLFKSAETSKVRELFHKYIDDALEYAVKECEQVMNVPVVNQVVTCIDFLYALYVEALKVHPAGISEPHMEKMFFFALCWSVGGILEQKGRVKFDKYLRGITNSVPKDPTSSETIYEFFVDASTTEWRRWQTIVPVWKYPGDKLEFSTLYVPTVDSVRAEFIVRQIASQSKPVLLIGNSGTAKTVIVEQYLQTVDPEVFVAKKINFSSATTPNLFQKTIEASLDKRIRTFGPIGGKKMNVFIDDINMPEINEWGDQETNEIVRQLIEYKGVYSLDKPGEWKSIVDLFFIAAMSHPGGGKNDIPNRLKRHFSIFNITLPEIASIDQIYGSIMRGRFGAKSGFSTDIGTVAEKLTELTISFWKKIAEKMLPTPNKFHYIFNLRDLSRVFQGIMFCPNECITSVDVLVGLWKHECTRVFADRLNEVSDKIWFDETIQSMLQSNIEVTERMKQPMYFVNFLRDPKIDEDTGEEIEPAPKIYEPIESLQKLRDRLEHFMAKFNEGSKTRKLDLVLFDSALKNVIRISRIISLPRGNALLVGVGGSGKQSLTRLASFIAGNQTFQITLTKTYNATNLFENLRDLYKTAGVLGKPITFLFTDNEIKSETFLEYINNVLSSGEVAGLFLKEELDSIVNDLRPIAKKEKPDTIGKNDTWDNLYRYFIDRVRDNLHLVLCFSPVGEKFRSRAAKFPGLIGGCTINWFFPWNEDALVDVASKFLNDYEIDCEPAVKRGLVYHMATVHRAMNGVAEEYFQRFRRHVYSTPKSYLSFIDNFKSVYQSKYAQIKALAEKVNGGLAKLQHAAAEVKQLQIGLKEKEVNLAVAQKQTEELLKEIAENTEKAERKKQEVSKVKEVLAVDAAEVARGKEEAETDLAIAKPALIEAQEALNAITPRDIQFLKGLKTPPDLVKRVFDGVLILRHFPLEPVRMVEVKGRLMIKDSYERALGMMTDIGFLKALLTFERDSINEETIELLEPYLKQEDFTSVAAKKTSQAVAGLCTWVRAMYTYHNVSKAVGPKIEALRVAEAKLRVANAKLKAKEDELAVVQSELDKIQSDFDAAKRKKQDLQDDADRTRRRMEAANNLIVALSDERERWTQQSNEFKDLIRRLVGDAALSCAFISYCGPFNSEFRSLLQNKHFYADCVTRNIPVTENLNIVKLLTDEAVVGEWNLEGLPTDDHSIQNGIMVTRSSKWPLLVDPQGQGIAWLKNREAANDLRVCQLTDKNFRNYLEECISCGRPMIIENIEEEIDPMLDPVLEKIVVRASKNSKVITVADKAIDYNDNFRLFLTTKLANPHFQPELYAKTTVIDFTVTMDGLEQQLLGQVIQTEKKELEEQRTKLLQDVNLNQKNIKKYEDDLLQILHEAKGNLLDDEKLVSVLATTKKASSEVKEKLLVAMETEKRINAAREEFRLVATRGSVLYFVIVEMSLVNPMYQTSLKQFLELFHASIIKSAKAPIPAKRIENIINYCTYLVYQYVSRGLFKRHKFLFVLLLACKILLRAGKITFAAFNSLLKGGAALDIKTARNKLFDWLPDSAWLNILDLADNVEAFKTLPDLMHRNEKLWRYMYDSEEPETAKVPDVHDKITPFEQLCLIRSIREDRTMVAAFDFIRETLGNRYVDPLPTTLDEALEESTNRTPLICLLSPGSDPSGSIIELAKKRKIPNNYISMGQGQEEGASRMMATGFANGSWVILQNCHLGLPFLSYVEETMLTTQDIHPEFRLWITSEPDPKFPIGLLQMSIKITSEAPVGVKAGLARSYQWVTQDMLDASKRPEWKPLLYTVCFLNSIVQERRKFGPLGWNIPYEFNHSDLAASFSFLQNHFAAIGDDFKKGPQVNWPTVRYMICEVQYGGRITDEFDRRLFNTYGNDWLDSKIVLPTFKYFPGYTIPNCENIQEYRDFIERLHPIDKPEIFGIHANGDIKHRTNQSQEVLSTILDVQPKESSGSGGATREDAVAKIAEDLIEKLKGKDFNKEKVKEDIKRLGGRSNPLNIFLGQEVDNLQRVISVTRKTLSELILAIKGTIIMSATLQSALNALYDARVPSSWLKVSWTSANLGLWFTELLGRHEQLDKWLASEAGTRPKSFWLTGFFNPQGFLTAVRQEVTRSNSGWALDDVVLKTEVTRYDYEELMASKSEAPSEGVYIHGLFLDGAAWDKKASKLRDSDPKILYPALPVLYVTAQLAADKKNRPDHTYICPCYKTPTRTDLNYIFDVDLNTDDNPNKWILRGVALLCKVD